MAFDFSEFFKVAQENGGYVLAMVIGYNTILGMFGVAGKWQALSGLLLGIIIGGAFQVAGLGVPQSFAAGFAIFAYGSLMGLAAIGLYETGKKIGTKVVAEIVNKLVNQPPVQ